MVGDLPHSEFVHDRVKSLKTGEGAMVQENMQGDGQGDNVERLVATVNDMDVSGAQRVATAALRRLNVNEGALEKAFSDMDQTQTQEVAAAALSGLQGNNQTALTTAFSNMDPQKTQQIATAALTQVQKTNASAARSIVDQAGVPRPSGGTADRLWLILVLALSLVVVAAVGGLLAATFVKTQGNNVQVIVTVFTTATAALVGLFAPNPTQSRSSAG